MKVQILTLYHVSLATLWRYGMRKRYKCVPTLTHFLNPGTRWRQMVSCISWLLYLQVKHVLHPLNVRLGGPHSQSGHFEEEQILLPKRGIKAQLLSHPDHDIVIILRHPHSQHENLNTLILKICVKFSLDSCNNTLYISMIMETVEFKRWHESYHIKK
jgi:hypothetical protein